MSAQDSVMYGSSSPPGAKKNPLSSPSNDISVKPQPNQTDELLKRANEEVYKQNVELAIRNKTLSTLRSLYSITMSSFTIEEAAHRIVETIVNELKFSAVMIHHMEKTQQMLRPIAASNPNLLSAYKSQTDDTLRYLTFEEKDNVLIEAIRANKRKTTTDLFDIFRPFVSIEKAQELTHETNIQTLIVYPLLLFDYPIGTLTIGLTKKEDDLSRAEREALDELINVVAIALDRAKLIEDIKNANDQLKLLDKLKDEFVSVASHELRTPMTAIKSYTWLLQKGKAGELTPKAMEYVKRIYASCERLIHLVNEMLDVSRIESGRIQIKKESFNICTLLTDVVAEFQARAEETKISINLGSCTVAPTVYADREKIHQVLENLIGNSCKFTSIQGHITVSAQENQSMMEITVQDDGIGIKKEDLPNLFKKFSRAENSLTTIDGIGSGLGLYITKQFIELHGGTITLSSEFGKGTRVMFTLPRSA